MHLSQTPANMIFIEIKNTLFRYLQVFLSYFSVGVQGSQGMTGFEGMVGNTGLKGLPGEQGQIGTLGPKGEKGGMGQAGHKGFYFVLDMWLHAFLDSFACDN